MRADFVSVYNYFSIGSISILLLSLYFVILSFFPTFDFRKINERKAIGLISGYFGIAVCAVMLVGWYWLIEEMLVFYSKERCVLEIMRNAPYLSFWVLLLKILAFPVFFYVFSLRHLDLELKGLPFAGIRLKSVLFGSVFFLIEKIIDLIFLKKTLSFLELSGENYFKVHTGIELLQIGSFPFFWGIIYLITGLILTGLLCFVIKYFNEDTAVEPPAKIRMFRIAVGVISALFFASFILAYNNEMCPWLLDLENHRCVFCLMQYSFDMAVMVFVHLSALGLLLGLVFLPYSFEPSGSMPQRNLNIFTDKMQSLLRTALILVTVGYFMFIARAVFRLLF